MGGGGEQVDGGPIDANDPTSPCYRGPDQDTWFDATCVHPTPDGHRALANMFMAIIDE